MTDRGLLAAHQVVEEVLRLSRTDGCIAIVEESSQAEVRFANNTTTTNGVRRDRRVIVLSIKESDDGVHAGMASRSGEVDLEGMVRSAEQDASSSPPVHDASPLMGAMTDSSFEEPPLLTAMSALKEAIEGLSTVFSKSRAEDRVLAGFAEHHLDTVYLGTSNGLRRRHSQPTGALQLVARSTDGTRSAWVGRGTTEISRAAIEDMDQQLTTRLGWADRTLSLPAGRYEVVMPPEAVTDMMVALVEATGGQEAEEGRTVFSKPAGGTRLGEQISPHPFELRSDPNELDLECQPFLTTGASGPDVSIFDNGHPLARTTWLEEGRLGKLLYHRAGAARSGTEFCAPIDNLVLELPGATGAVEDLVSRTERGLLLTCLWYIREADPANLLLTGLTRDGVYLIEGGEVVGAVNNFRFNESPVDLLARASEAGGAVRSLGREFGEWMNRTKMPPLRIPDFNMSSTSAAS